MQITRETDIALRALITLAGDSEQQTTVPKLAVELSVPQRYLGKVVMRLSAVGWVTTSRGRHGGLVVSPQGCAVTAADVIRLLEPGRMAINCHDPFCPLVDGRCRLRGLLFKAEADFMASMDNLTIADLACQAPAADTPDVSDGVGEDEVATATV